MVSIRIGVGFGGWPFPDQDPERLWHYVDTAEELVCGGVQADLLIGNNVLAHVPDLNDFVEGMRMLLKPRGVITMEFPHLLRLMDENQFDTIYHEHLCYFSFISVEKVFAAHCLAIFDVEELSTHGGSLRIYARHANNEESTTKHVQEISARLRSLFSGAATSFRIPRAHFQRLCVLLILFRFLACSLQGVY